MDDQTLEDRLRSVERAVTDADTNPDPRRNYDDRLSTIERRLQELEAATQALRGYVGDVRHRDDRPHESGLDTVQHTDGRDTIHPIDDTHPPDVPTEPNESLLDRWL